MCFWASAGFSARPGCSCNLPGIINSLSVYSGLSPCTAVIVVEETTCCMFLMQYSCVTVMSAETGLAVGLDEIIEAWLNFLSRIGEGAKERYAPVCGGERERERTLFECYQVHDGQCQIRLMGCRWGDELEKSEAGGTASLLITVGPVCEAPVWYLSLRDVSLSVPSVSTHLWEKDHWTQRKGNTPMVD